MTKEQEVQKILDIIWSGNGSTEGMVGYWLNEDSKSLIKSVVTRLVDKGIRSVDGFAAYFDDIAGGVYIEPKNYKDK